MKQYVRKFLRIFITTIVIAMLVIGVAFGGAILGYWGGIDDIDVETLTLNQTSVIVYTDPKTGEEAELQKITSSENREWVDIENVPQDLQDAFIAIEDERFMEHKGYDLLRTAKATLTYVGNKLIGKSGVSLGGSTITQQLIKNVTGERDQTPIRKIKEISRAVAIEKQLDKSQILELYLNCIYLSRGCNGVQTASRTYFGKDVSELGLAECASLAGITQNPAAYDPISNPNNNKQRQMLVLGKMLELGYITQDEYDAAADEELAVMTASEAESGEPESNSYFVDQVIYEVLRDLEAHGYSKSLANKIVYSGGVKIYSTYVPAVQKAIEDFYSDEDNFSGSGAQSAITVVDVATGQVVGIAGGIGEKNASLTLNRASQSPRQPGSTIKPIAAYAPAIENEVITPISVYNDVAKDYNGWTPKNYDRAYRGKVDIRTAVRKSLNTVPVEIINEMGVQTSYDFMTQKLGFTTLVERRDVDGFIFSDIGLSQLGLGGLTDGVTTMEMAAAYAAFANGGIYTKPYTYTEVVDRDGNAILTSDRSSNTAMKESTAFIMTQLLKEVVSSGTGVGASVSGVNYTAGKTGTTSDNNDRWFVGYTPYYSAAVWYGYDIPKEITLSSNPCIPVFRKIMNDAHAGLESTSRKLDVPNDVIRVSYCTYSGYRATDDCPETDSYYFASGNIPSYCGSGHEGYVPPEEEDEEEEEDSSNDDDGSGASNTEEPIGGALEE